MSKWMYFWLFGNIFCMGWDVANYDWWYLALNTLGAFMAGLELWFPEMRESQQRGVMKITVYPWEK